MVHAFSFHLEGKCAWKIKIPDVSDDSAPSDTYSSRVAAWNVGILGPWQKIITKLTIVWSFVRYAAAMSVHLLCVTPISCLRVKVLADDQNQDRLRSVIRVFAAARAFLGQYVSCPHILKISTQAWSWHLFPGGITIWLVKVWHISPGSSRMKLAAVRFSS